MPGFWAAIERIWRDSRGFLALEYGIICGALAAAVVVGFAHYADGLTVALDNLLAAF